MDGHAPAQPARADGATERAVAAHARSAPPAALGRWLTPLRRGHRAPIVLVCCPYAGASAAALRGWSSVLPPCVEPYAVQLPGRAGRLREPSCTSLPALVETLADALACRPERPTIVFGHSMGALIAFELTRSLRRRGRRQPLALMLSGCRAPHIAPRARLHDLPEDELVARLQALGGTPAEVFDNRELLELVLPAVRADLQLAETYRHAAEAPLDVPIAAFAGDADETAPVADVGHWRAHTSAAFSLDLFAGAHFFLHTASAFAPTLARRLVEAGAPT